MGKNLVLIVILIIIVFASQFILARKQLDYGFYNDDWYVLGWYKQVVGNPILDMPKAFKEIGPHNFVHAYYMGVMFDFFKLNYPYYHVINTLLKALAVLSFFPVVYLLFKSKFLAFLATFIFAVHFSPYGVIYHVIGGEGSLVVIFMNLFLAVYIYSSQKHLLNNVKILFLLLALLLTTASFEITRAYPVLLFLPFLEFINFFVNRASTNVKAILLRLLFLYSPFIFLLAYHPSALNEINFNKFIRIIDWGNYQLILTIFSSFGSTFVPEGLIDQLNLFARIGEGVLYRDLETFLTFLIFRFLIISIPLLIVISSLVGLKPKWILRSLFLIISFSILAFWLANHWLYLDPKLRAPVDPSTYFIPALIGLFVFSCAISFLIEWFYNRGNNLLFSLALAPIFSLLYTFLTWILVDDNAIFMGVHAYLNIPAIGSSLFLAILLYLTFQKLLSNQSKIIGKFVASFTIIYFLFFITFSAHQIDKFFSYWLKTGFAASEQERMHNSFWKEVGLGKSETQDPVLIYHDGSQDNENGYFYANSFVWSIPAMLTVEKGLPFDPGGYCKAAMSYKDFENLRIEEVNGKKMVVQSGCGNDLYYSLENFFAFKMINRDLVPIRLEVLKLLGIE